MNYIHFGSYTAGPSDQDVPFALNTRSKTVTIPPFYMDIHEITNNEYRQFVYYMEDSLMLSALTDEAEEYTRPTEDMTGIGRLRQRVHLELGQNIKWDDEDIQEILYDEFYLKDRETYYDRLEIDTRKLNYTYYWVNLNAAHTETIRTTKKWAHINQTTKRGKFWVKPNAT